MNVRVRFCASEWLSAKGECLFDQCSPKSLHTGNLLATQSDNGAILTPALQYRGRHAERDGTFHDRQLIDHRESIQP